MRGQQILTEQAHDLETLAGPARFETLTGDEIKDLLVGKRPTRESVIEPTPRARVPPPASAARPETGAGAAAAGVRLCWQGNGRTIASPRDGRAFSSAC